MQKHQRRDSGIALLYPLPSNAGDVSLKNNPYLFRFLGDRSRP
jgi:hypothetical protein